MLGANWGDEGKGKITDVLGADADFVVRFQGGSNAGHTIINEYGKFALHLLPSGVFHDGVINVLGPGVAVDIRVLLAELESLRIADLGNEERLRTRVAHSLALKNPLLEHLYGRAALSVSWERCGTPITESIPTRPRHHRWRASLPSVQAFPRARSAPSSPSPRPIPRALGRDRS